MELPVLLMAPTSSPFCILMQKLTSEGPPTRLLDYTPGVWGTGLALLLPYRSNLRKAWHLLPGEPSSSAHATQRWFKQMFAHARQSPTNPWVALPPVAPVPGKHWLLEACPRALCRYQGLCEGRQGLSGQQCPVVSPGGACPTRGRSLAVSSGHLLSSWAWRWSR